MKKYLFTVLALMFFLPGGLRMASAQYEAFNAADTRELQAFQLNDDLVARYRDVTLAFAEYTKSHPDKNEVDEKNSNNEGNTISDFVAGFSKAPQFGVLLRSKGISSRQYVETMIVLTVGYSMVSMQHEGQAAHMKPSPVVSTANLEYIKRNYEHLSTLLTQMANMGDQ